MMDDTDCFCIPADIVENSVGFSLDVGGSAAKLVYRSTEDYEKGKPRPGTVKDGRGKVRVTIFACDEVDDIIEFMCKKCDVTSCTNGGIAYTTGINSFMYLSKIQEKFGDIKFQSLTEFNCVVRSFMYLVKHSSKYQFCYAPDDAGIKDGEDKLKKALELIKRRSKKIPGRKFYSKAEKGKTDQVVIKEDTDPKSTDSSREAAKGSTVTLPCILEILGSKSSLFQIDENGTFTLNDGIAIGGKVFSSVCNIICGKCMGFDELMDLANQGDIGKVGVKGEDFSMKGNGVDDIYADIEDDRILFPFGKPCHVSPEKFSKCDLLAGWVNVAADSCVQYAQLLAKHHDIGQIYMAGNFCKSVVTRRAMTRSWVIRNGLNSEGRSMEMNFIYNGGFLGSLGAFMSESSTEITS